MSAPVTRCSRDLRYLWVSKPYADWLGRSVEDITGRSIADVIGADAFAAIAPHVERVLAGERVEYEAQVPFPAPGLRWIHAVYTPTFGTGDQPDGWVAVVLDVDERRRTEDVLRTAIASAEHARQEAEATARARDEFLAMLGHELRNPLGAIASAVAVLRLGTPDTTERAREVIGRQTLHLSRLVDDLLDVSRVMSGKVVLDRRPIDLGELVSTTLGTWRATARLDRHTVSIETASVWIFADELRIEQVISNLLENALKYTPAEGHVAVRVFADGDTAVLEVADDGIGIAPELIGRIFDLFVQGHQTLDRAQGGLGLGLTLVRALVRAHGGEVQARSDGPGRGAAFTMRLPRVLAPSRETPRAAPMPSVSAPRRILIIEDNDDAREMLRVVLAREGHDVYEAADGPTGIDVAASVVPDVALIDIGLPHVDGYETARRIRAGRSGTAILLIAVTGYGQAEDRQRALAAGFDTHLTKPVSVEQVAAAIDQRMPR